MNFIGIQMREGPCVRAVLEIHLEIIYRTKFGANKPNSWSRTFSALGLGLMLRGTESYRRQLTDNSLLENTNCSGYHFGDTIFDITRSQGQVSCVCLKPRVP